MEHSDVADFEHAQRAVSELRAQLNQLNEKLRPLFVRKDEIRVAIISRLERVKVLRAERDALTVQVKQHKVGRSQAEQEFKSKMGVVKGLPEVKDVGFYPDQIKRQIERLEYTIETEVMSFDKEQKLVKKIKELQKKLDEARKVQETRKTVRVAHDELRTVRKKGEEEHHLVQQQAAESQKKHEELMLLLKEVDGFRVQEKEVRDAISTLKEGYDKLRKDLEDALMKLGETGKKVDAFRDEVRETKRKHVEEILEQKMKSVEEKLKKGGKLTTQDLLAWQARKE
jgi:uncharacterized coiled-coil DUF342 family protein